MRLLAVDFGEKRVGIACSDPLGMLAQTWGVLERTSNRAVAERVAGLVVELGAEAVLLGMPFDEDGSEGYQARRVRRFGDLLQELLAVPLIYWDESLTSQDAEALWLERGARRPKRKRSLDDMAAALLLQSYLDRRRDAAPTDAPDSEPAGAL